MEATINRYAGDFVLSPQQVADTLDISLKTLRRRWADGSGPRRIRVSERRIGVRASDLEHYLSEVCEEVS